MRLPCPLCGERDIREFGCTGAAVLLDRPAPDAGPAAWDDYLHLRDNPAGPVRELWYHAAGCAAWLVVERDTVTHAVADAWLAADRKVASVTEAATVMKGGRATADAGAASGGEGRAARGAGVEGNRDDAGADGARDGAGDGGEARSRRHGAIGGARDGAGSGDGGA